MNFVPFTRIESLQCKPSTPLRYVFAATVFGTLSTAAPALWAQQPSGDTPASTAADGGDTAQERLDPVVVVSTALKINAPLVETPRSASVVDRQELDTRNVQSLDESLRYRSGVLSAPYGNDNDADWLFVRGFEASTYLDDTRLYKDGYYAWTLEPFGLDRVEVLKGPASMLYGEGYPGGVVNAISKRPTAERQGLLELQAGNRDHRQIGIDSSGPLTRAGDVRYRLVGLYKERDGELNGTDSERYYFAPSLEIDVSEDTTLTLLGSVKHDDAVPTNGFFMPYGTLVDTPYGKVDRRTNLGEPGYDRNRHTQTSLGYQLEHRFNDTWSYTQNLRWSRLDLDLRSTYANYIDPTNDRNVVRGLTYRDGTTDSYALDNRFVGHWRSGRFDNTLLLGLDLQRHEYSGNEFDSFNSAAGSFGEPLDMFSPVYGRYQPIDPNEIDYREIDKTQGGAYAQHRLKIDDKWIFLGSVRYDRVKTENDNRTSGETLERTDNNTSWSGGIMYLADNGLAPYVSYAESFEVLTTYDPATGGLYRPLEGKQWEAGLKYTPPGFDGYLSAAVFDLTQRNSLVTNPNTFVQTQAGEVQSTGLELEGQAQLTDGLTLTASYTYTDATTDETGGQGTQRAGIIPRHIASTWLDYDFNQGPLTGLSLGAGVRYVGTSTDDPRYDTPKVPAYTLVDAMASYDFDEHWRAQLNVNNLTDEDYISACNYWCYYGESRSVIGSVAYRW
ncbi:TonB-dependent siderophore receptor [Halotalea alkalilenta]|uniref:TonB-dependent siderophore receptor n=1 Tax=Halotalea alkalilenta TaxID=376489 RepID=UPI0009DD5792|nr:TonB-dependent siderophore receptor [Halotalea alkalilenta]